jgi:hypothetical protein
MLDHKLYSQSRTDSYGFVLTNPNLSFYKKICETYGRIMESAFEIADDSVLDKFN